MSVLKCTEEGGEESKMVGKKAIQVLILGAMSYNDRRETLYHKYTRERNLSTPMRL